MVFCVFQLLLVSPHAVNWNLLEKQTENGNAMKKIQSIFPLLWFVGIVLLFAACSQEELGTPFYAGQEVSISAALSNSNNNEGKKRISGKDNVDKIDLTWDEGDEILVTVGDKSAVFTLSSGAGTNNATFKGAMPANGISYSVSYPVGYSDDVLDVQPYVENGFGKGLMKMSTKTEGTIDNSFTLSADNALLGLQLTGDVVIHKIVVTNKDDKNTYTLDCSAHEVRVTEGLVFYIVLPADTWSNGMKVEVYNAEGVVIETKEKYDAITFSANNAMMMSEVLIKQYRYGFTQAEWDAATDSWGHGGRAHAPADQSCIQGTIVRGIRLKVGREGSIDVYKVPSLLEMTTDNFQLVTTLTADSMGVTDFDFAHPIYIGQNEYLVFGHPLKSPPTLLPCYNPKSPSQPFAHFIGTEKAKMTGASLMVDFY